MLSVFWNGRLKAVNNRFGLNFYFSLKPEILRFLGTGVKKYMSLTYLVTFAVNTFYGTRLIYLAQALYILD